MKGLLAQVAAFGLLPWAVTGCGGEGTPRCGPSRATVTRVIDGDTVELEDGSRVRYLMIDTPEISGGADDCYGPEARDFNAALVEGRQVGLRYDLECTDHYGRLLAYVFVERTEVNLRMVEYGYACVLVIPPNGADRELAYKTAEAEARADERGMWNPDVCEEVACDR